MPGRRSVGDRDGPGARRATDEIAGDVAGDSILAKMVPDQVTSTDQDARKRYEQVLLG